MQDERYMIMHAYHGCTGSVTQRGLPVRSKEGVGSDGRLLAILGVPPERTTS